jgi:hypothetical protein
MVSGKKQYGKLFFKLLLFTVYFLFFTVQIFLRFASPNSQQVLGQQNLQRSSAPYSATNKSILSKANPEKSKSSSSYLNKHYHPKDSVGIAAQEFHLTHSYPECLTKFHSRQEKIAGIKLNTAFLRGPPSVS